MQGAEDVAGHDVVEVGVHIEARASDVVEGGDDAEKSAEDNGEEAARRRHHGVEPEWGEGRTAGAQHCILLVHYIHSISGIKEAGITAVCKVF